MDHVDADDHSKLQYKPNRKGLNDNTIVAVAIAILLVGYDTTGMAMSWCAYELAMNPDTQKRLQDEIDNTMAENGHELPDYAQTMEMEYLDMVLHETVV